MNRFWFVCFLSLLMVACGEKNNENVTVLHGEIKGMGNDTLYLYGADRLYDTIDTLIVKNNRFSAQLKIDTLVDARLLFGDGTIYPIILNKREKIEVKGEIGKLGTLQVKGNKENEELTKFFQETDTLADTAISKKAETFIKNHPASLACLYLLDRYFVQQEQFNRVLIQQLIKGMTGELKDRPYTKGVIDLLEENEKTDLNRNPLYFQLPNREGERISRNNYREKYLLMHFWASWDTASRAANKALKKLYEQEKKNTYFSMLGVSLDYDREAWEEAIDADTLLWEQVCDFKGWESSPVKGYAVRTLPTNVLVNPAGRIEAYNLSEEELHRKVNEIERREKEKEEARKKRERNKRR